MDGVMDGWVNVVRLMDGWMNWSMDVWVGG